MQNIVKQAIAQRLNGGLAIDKYIGNNTSTKEDREAAVSEYRAFLATLKVQGSPTIPAELKGSEDVIIISDTPYPDICSSGAIENIFGIPQEHITIIEKQKVIVHNVSAHCMLSKAMQVLGEYGILSFTYDLDTGESEFTGAEYDVFRGATIKLGYA